MVGLLLHVMVVVVGPADLFENLLFFFLEYVRLRVRDNASDVGLDRIFSARVIGYRARNPKNKMNVAQTPAGSSCACLDFRFRMPKIFIRDTDEYDDPVGNPARELEHLR